MSSSAEDKVELNILLNREETKSSEIKRVHFQSLPTTPLEIKKKLEEDFSIPSCVQTLHYQSMILKDSDQLQRSHFRSGDTFTVHYPIEAECEIVKNVIKWLKELLELLKSIADSEADSHPYEDELRDLIIEGENDKIVEALCYKLFTPWEEKKKLMNKFFFQYEGGLDVLIKIYRILVSKEWGDLGIHTDVHIYLERKCTLAISNYLQTISLRRQVSRLGGLELCTTTLLRRQLQGQQYIPDALFNTLFYSLCILSNLSELRECQVSVATKRDVMDQTLAVALNPAYDCKVAYVSASIFLNLTQSPEAHAYIVRREIIEKLFEMCELKHKMVSEQSSRSRQGEKDDPIAVIALKGYTSIVLAQVGLGSPQLLFDRDSIPRHLVHQILSLMSDTLEAASPAEIRQYEEKEKFEWGTFLPYLQYLYKPTVNIEAVGVEHSNDCEDIGVKLYINCCSVLLNGLENALGRELHLKVLLREGLLDYTMCLPAVLPGECQTRARSLVNELSKHRKLQPPSLCTLAKAHIAKMFCGLQAVMEMNSLGEFVQKYFSAS